MNTTNTMKKIIHWKQAQECVKNVDTALDLVIWKKNNNNGSIPHLPQNASEDMVVSHLQAL